MGVIVSNWSDRSRVPEKEYVGRLGQIAKVTEVGTRWMRGISNESYRPYLG
ncbi:hypothetical protein [Paenibacillus silvae]|uniref:hypothetical protein n=1 Tax=Paenibacillus silvae TaxID=1325358 RepID=UPI00142E85B3|nr:hypothetical protein [Paenibacillus silvae]